MGELSLTSGDGDPSEAEVFDADRQFGELEWIRRRLAELVESRRYAALNRSDSARYESLVARELELLTDARATDEADAAGSG